MSSPLVVILMGSSADRAHCDKIAEAVRAFGLDVEMHIGSAHKTPQHVLSILQRCEATGRPRVYITVAGRSNALSGFTDAAVSAPVIACPPPSEAFGGADVYSSLRMPSGVAPALVLEPQNAALLAAKILATGSPELQARITAYQQKQAEKILADEAALQTSRGDQ